MSSAGLPSPSSAPGTSSPGARQTVACGTRSPTSSIERSLLRRAAPPRGVRKAAELAPHVRDRQHLVRAARPYEEELVRVRPRDEKPAAVRRPNQAREVAGAGEEAAD